MQQEGRMLAPDETLVTLVLEEEGADLEQLEEELRYLLDEVAQLEGATVDRLDAAPAPPGTRGGAGTELGTALIALGSGGAILPVLVALLRDWLGRRASGSIRLKIGSDEVTMDHVPGSLQRQVLEEFLDRHRG
jgi:hypothetical protein